MNIMEETFEIRSCIEYLAIDISLFITRYTYWRIFNLEWVRHVTNSITNIYSSLILGKK